MGCERALAEAVGSSTGCRTVLDLRNKIVDEEVVRLGFDTDRPSDCNPRREAQRLLADKAVPGDTVHQLEAFREVGKMDRKQRVTSTAGRFDELTSQQGSEVKSGVTSRRHKHFDTSLP